MKSRKRISLCLLLIVLVGCNRDSGDRVLVSKFQYDLAPPERYDVVVFKWPGDGRDSAGPVEDGVPKNYIKRLLGLPGEIIALFFGQLFHCPPEEGAPTHFAQEDKDVDPTRLWEKQFTHPTAFSLTSEPVGDADWVDDSRNAARKVKKLYQTPGKFEILRKPADVIMAMRRIVYDNDHQAKDLTGPEFRRWNPAPDSKWKAADDYRTFTFNDDGGNNMDWLRYQHIVATRGGPNDGRGLIEPKPQLITDFTGYNAFYVLLNGQHPMDNRPAENWVGDLMLECNVNVDKAQGEFTMELNRGMECFQARFNLTNGECSLWRQFDSGDWQKIGEPKATALKAPGNYDVRFANFDARLMVWVNGSLPFAETEGDYPAPELPRKGETLAEVAKRLGPTEADLKKPASLGAKGTQLEVSHVRLWRDTYYTGNVNGPDANRPPEDWSDPKTWDSLRDLSVHTMYVQPDHFLCLGDNSTASSDSRSWGLVARRLMLGRALAVYWPPSRVGPIH